jgi:hypothetical protein
MTSPTKIAKTALHDTPIMTTRLDEPGSGAGEVTMIIMAAGAAVNIGTNTETSMSRYDVVKIQVS